MIASEMIHRHCAIAHSAIAHSQRLVLRVFPLDQSIRYFYFKLTNWRRVQLQTSRHQHCTVLDGLWSLW